MKTPFTKILIVITFLVGTTMFGQEHSQKDLQLLFQAFTETVRPTTNKIYNHGVDIAFLKNDSKFVLLNKNDIGSNDSFIMFHTFDVQNNIGRIRYTVTNDPGKENQWSSLFFDLTKGTRLIKKN